MTRIQTRWLLLPLTVALFALAPAAASAGTFVHHSCGVPGSSSHGWTATNNHSAIYAERDNCSAGTGRVGVRFKTGAGPWSPGAYGQVTYQAPADLRISRWQYRQYGDYFGENGLGTNSSKISFYVKSETGSLEHRTFQGGNSFSGYRTHNLDTSRVAVEISCFGGTPPPGCGQPHPTLEAPFFHTYENYVTLRDELDPSVTTVTGDVTGNGPHRAIETLLADTADRGSGIYRSIVTVDGVERWRTPVELTGTCRDANPSDPRYEFTDNTPCPLSKRVEVSIDTTKLTDGAHDLSVSVEDASGNTTPVLHDGSFVVDNVPPPVNSMRPSIAGSPQHGVTLTANAGTWIGNGITYAYRWSRCDVDGGNCAPIAIADQQTYVAGPQDVGKRLRVTVTATNSDGSTEAESLPTPLVASPSSLPGDLPDRVPGGGGNPSGHGARGAANGSNASDRAKLTAFTRNKQSRVRTRFGRTIELSGRLVDEHGRAIGGAEIEIISALRRAAATNSRVGSVKTAADGTYRYRLRATASRTVRFAYRAYAGDHQFADTSDVEVLVTGAAKIKVNRRVTVNKRRVMFSGRLRGELPTKGIVVVLQAKVGKKWQTFAHTRTRAGGKFKKSYRFLRTYRTQIYRFRARLLRDVNWAYEPGLTNQVKVKVRGR